ncbi:MAG: hypothetical protein AB1798_12490 [Spirochaetota bacterium]
MEIGQTVMILSRLGIGAAAAFFAILLWSNTRDTAWMFIVMGIIVNFGEVMFSTLEIFGLVHGETYLLAGIPVVKVVFSNLPNVFFIIAFCIMILRLKVRFAAHSTRPKEEDSEASAAGEAKKMGKRSRKIRKKSADGRDS